MPTQPSPAAVAVSFTKAWTSHDLETAAAYLADDVVYHGPVNTITGSGPYMQALERFALAVTNMELIAVLADEEQALIMYRVSTGPFGELTCGRRVTVREGKIQTDLVAFDMYAIRAAQAASAAA